MTKIKVDKMELQVHLIYPALDGLTQRGLPFPGFSLNGELWWFKTAYLFLVKQLQSTLQHSFYVHRVSFHKLGLLMCDTHIHVDGSKEASILSKECLIKPPPKKKTNKNGQEI